MKLNLFHQFINWIIKPKEELYFTLDKDISFRRDLFMLGGDPEFYQLKKGDSFIKLDKCVRVKLGENGVYNQPIFDIKPENALCSNVDELYKMLIKLNYES